jgi:hypothetical protein
MKLWDDGGLVRVERCDACNTSVRGKQMQHQWKQRSIHQPSDLNSSTNS